MPAIYLDHNATSSVDPRVVEAMAPYWLIPGNPESQHTAGRAARRALLRAKEQIAEILGADEREVIFTSGGTESNNLAIFSLAQRFPRPGSIVTSPLEHPAVHEPICELARRGFEIKQTSVTNQGLADLEEMTDLITPDTHLATLLLAHNETGAIQDLKQLAQSAMEHGVPVHTDGVQAVGRIPVHFHDLGVTSLAATAHKFHGPTGIGLLLIKDKSVGQQLLFGGNQQDGYRPGTPSVALAVGTATALKLWQTEATQRIDTWLGLRERLLSTLVAALGPQRVIQNGPEDLSSQLPQTLNIGFSGIDGRTLLMQLDLAGIYASFGAACASGSLQPSPSMIAMGLPSDRIHSSVRFSFGAFTTKEDIDEAASCVIRIIRGL